MGVKRPWQIYVLLVCYLLGISYIINFMHYGIKNLLSFCILGTIILIFLILITLLFIRHPWAYKTSIALLIIISICSVINMGIMLFMPGIWLIVTPISSLFTIYAIFCSSTRIDFGIKKKLIEIDLFSFIKDGTFGNIEIGMRKAEILNIFPPPDDWMDGFSIKYSPIWRYGNFELHFDNQRLSFIFNDYLDDVSAGNQLVFRRWIFGNKNIYLDDILRIFDQYKISYDISNGKGSIEIIIKSSNVVLSFNDDENSKSKKIISLTKKLLNVKCIQSP